MGKLSLWFLLGWAAMLLAACGSGESDDDVAADPGDDAALTDDDDAPPVLDDDTTAAGGDDDLDKLQDMFDRMEVDKYIGLEPAYSKPGPNGYTYYYFRKSDCRCTFGDEMKVAVHEGTENKVMLFMEGGGAEWPRGGFAVPLNFPWDIGFKSFDENNPLHEWSYVYVPHCDHSLHTGDNEVFFDGHTHYYHGLRQLSGAVTLMKKLFPNPEKIVVAGSSAGGYGTIMGWAVVKSQYLDTDTYIINDSGTGFWNPFAPATFETIKNTWNLPIPEDCVKCQDSTIMTYIYELYLKYDAQVRIGLFSSYRDFVISSLFLGMEADDFQDTLMTVTDEIHRDYPDRFKRFFIRGASHTTYEFILDEGPYRAIGGLSFYEWIGQLVNDEPAWADLLE